MIMDRTLATSGAVVMLRLIALIVITAQATLAEPTEKGVTPPSQDDTSGKPDWTIQVGWHGLKPGKSSLSDAEKMLGKKAFDKTYRCYTFWNNEVNVSCDPKTHIIERIGIAPVAHDARVPRTIAEAEKLFGAIPMTQIRKSGGRLWEKKGLWIAGQEPGVITGLEMYTPKWASHYNLGQEHPSPINY
jgi:hypothetical protein